MYVTPILAQRLGTDRSFERLYRKHAGDVYRYALVVLRNEADAEDVTQTTFLNAYKAFERGERPRAPQNWLIAIAHNVCRQRFRQSQRRPNEVVFEEELAEAAVVEDDAVSAEDIRRALGHLAFNQRAALVMRELEGRSYQEIAEILELSVSAVETLIFRARRALREQLEDGISCHEAEFAISKQLDGRLERKERGALRAHLRECEECAGFARSQRAQRGSLKSLALIPLPQSLVGLFGGGGGGAAVGGGLAIKAAAVGASAMVATGVGYEGVKHGIWHPPGLSRASAVKQDIDKAAPAKSVVTEATLFTPGSGVRTDKRLVFAPAAVKTHPNRALGKPAIVRHEKRLKPAHHEVSSLPPSRARGVVHRPITPPAGSKRQSTVHAKKQVKPPPPPAKTKKPPPDKSRRVPPPPPPLPTPAVDRGKAQR
jgi:RNA polymerase sigma-70 factor, ECF subfamily